MKYILIKSFCGSIEFVSTYDSYEAALSAMKKELIWASGGGYGGFEFYIFNEKGNLLKNVGVNL